MFAKWKIAVTGVILGCMAPLAGAQPVNPIPQDTLLNYLDVLTQWQRDMASLEPSAANPRAFVFRDGVRDHAAHALQSGFVFLRSVANSEEPFMPVDPESTGARLQKQAQAMRDSLPALQGDARRVEQARLELLETILGNLNAASNKSPNKLRYTIESLARSIPEAQGRAPKTESAAPVAASPMARSLFGVGAALFDSTRKRRELQDAVARTAQLKKSSMELMMELRAGLGEDAPVEAEGAEADDGEATPEPPPLTPDQRVAAYKRLGAHIVPLAETMRWIDATKQTLNEWSGLLEQQREQLLRQFAIYLAVLVGTLLAAGLLSEMARRAIKRVPDGKRKRQLNAVRRIATGMAMLLILLFNFISDFGSFATFAGFLTAGLAVALQSVLLSLVAHFLFYGRYGVRVGDRIHVAGVTGDIIQIGMVRFYLRELDADAEGELKYTGKIVAFPNSILFQNVAFYKYASAA